MIVVVEPHADDAYLSLGASIERWVAEGERVGIVTVFSGTRARGAEAEQYARAVGADWVGLGLTETEPNGDTVVELPELAIPEVERRIFPLGLRHPEHRAVAAQAGDAERYVETPYQLVQSNRDELASLLVGRTITHYLAPPARKWRFHNVFKDQAMFMRYNPPSSLGRAVELVVR